MKVRHGFVSNSSSSSFIVAFPKKPKDAKAMREILFDKDQEQYPHPYDEKQSYSVSEVAETVFQDIFEQEEMMQKEGIKGWEKVAESLAGSQFPGSPDIKDYETPNGEFHYDWKKYNAACRKQARASLKNFKKDNPNTVLMVFTYSDNEGAYGCALEHGSLFDRLPSIRVSHH